MQVVSRKLRIGILPASTGGDDGIHCAASRHPFDGKSSRQRVTAHRGAKLGTYASPSLRGYVRIPMRADVVEAGNRKKPIPAIDRPQESFSAFVEHLDLTPPAPNLNQKGASTSGRPLLLFY